MNDDVLAGGPRAGTPDIDEMESLRREVERLRATMGAVSPNGTADRVHRDRMVRLQQMTASLNRIVTPDQVAELGLAAVVEGIAAVTGSLSLLVDDATAIETVHFVGIAPERRRQLRRFSMSEKVPAVVAIRTRRAVFIESPDELRTHYPMFAAAPIHDGGSRVSIPLLIEDRVFGAMNFGFREWQRFSPEDRAFLLATVAQGAQALERARLFEAERQARERAEWMQRQTAFLLNASIAMSASLNFRETLDRVARLAVPGVADWCAVEFAMPGRPETTQLAVTHIDPEKVRLAVEMRRRYPPRAHDPTGVPNVIRTGKPELYAEITDEMLAAGARDAEHLALARALELRSALIVPMVARGIIYGAITFVFAESGRRYAPSDLEIAESLGRRAGIAIDNSLLYERERRAAERLRVISEAGIQLAGSLDWENTVKRVVKLAIGRVSNWATLGVIDDAGEIRRVLTLHEDPARAELAAAFDQVPMNSARVLEAIASRRPQAVGPLKPEAIAARATSDRHLELANRLGIASYLVAPLVARDRTLGVLVYVRGDPERPFTDDDVALAEEIARRGALAMDNARLYRQATEAIAIRDDFLSIAGHELRTPLSAAVLQVESIVMLGGRGAAPERLVERAERARRNLDRLTLLIQELLDISRITTGRFHLELEDVDLGALVEDVCARHAEDLSRAGCALALDLEPDVTGRWDRTRIEQVVENLLTNAIRYGRGHPLRIAVARRGATARVEVRDRGIGIRPEDQKRIFERFERAVPSREYGGLGLGLWIVRQVVEAHQGCIGVESIPGEGATFVVELPFAAPCQEPS